MQPSRDVYFEQRLTLHDSEALEIISAVSESYTKYQTSSMQHVERQKFKFKCQGKNRFDFLLSEGSKSFCEVILDIRINRLTKTWFWRKLSDQLLKFYRDILSLLNISSRVYVCSLRMSDIWVNVRLDFSQAPAPAPKPITYVIHIFTHKFYIGSQYIISILL